MNLSTKQTHRAQTCGCQMGGSGEIEGLGLANASYYIGWINNNVLQDSTGNCIQYPVINHNEKNMKKNAQILPARMWNRVFICLFPTALIAYSMIVCECPDQQGAGSPGRRSWPQGRAGPLSDCRCNCLWAICSHDSHFAGVCRGNLWPGRGEKSHLRNWVISAITEGSDKCIPRVSTAFWDTDSPVARSHLKPERNLKST